MQLVIICQLTQSFWSIVLMNDLYRISRIILGKYIDSLCNSYSPVWRFITSNLYSVVVWWPQYLSENLVVIGLD